MDNGSDKLRVLVVDDDPLMIKLIGTSLHQKFSDSLHVKMTTEPAYVWGMAAEGKVDICISDLNMPGMNGFKLLKTLKNINTLTQVIFMTGHPTYEAAQSAFALGADDFLAKPVKVDELCNCVQFMANRIQRLRRDLLIEGAVHLP